MPDGSHEIARRGDLLITTDPGLLDLSVIRDFLANRSYRALGISRDVLRRALDASLCFGLYAARARGAPMPGSPVERPCDLAIKAGKLEAVALLQGLER
jgi:hypothetical protein